MYTIVFQYVNKYSIISERQSLVFHGRNRMLLISDILLRCLKMASSARIYYLQQLLDFFCFGLFPIWSFNSSRSPVLCFFYLSLFSFTSFHIISLHLSFGLPIFWCSIAVNMDSKKGVTFSFRWLSPDIYHINILRNPNEVDVNWSRSAKPK